MRNTDKFILDFFFLVHPGTLWLSLAPLAVIWCPFGSPLEVLWPSFGSLGLPGAPWEPRQMLFTIWSPLSEQIWRFARASAQDLASRNLPGSSRMLADARGNGVKNRPPDPISTRAGGQDDVS